MKEHKKMYKSGKLWVTATVLALAAGTALTTTTVHADTTVPSNQTTGNSQTLNVNQGSQANAGQNATTDPHQLAASLQSTNDQPVQTTNKINLPNGYADTLKNVQSDTTPITPATSNRLAQLGQQGMAMNHYHNDPEADTPLHFDNNGALSTEDSLKLTQYTAQLLNPVREAMGKPDFKISQGSLDVAHDVTAGYVADHWNPNTPGHDESRLNTVSTDWQVMVFESKGYDTQLNTTHLTMNNAKQVIYDTICRMLFTDQPQWGHTTHLVGAWSTPQVQVLLGTQIDRLGQVHFVTEKDTHGTQAEKIDVFNGQTMSLHTTDPNTRFNQEYKTMYPVMGTTTPTEATHTLTVNYVLADGTLVSHQSFSGHNGDAIAASRTQIPAGYDLDDNTNWNSHLTIGNQDNTITVHVTKHEDHHSTTPTEQTHTLTVNYVLTDGTLVSHQSFSGHNGDLIAASRTQIPAGYDLVGNANWNSHLTIGNADSTVTVTVARHEDHSTTPTEQTHTLTINYVLADGTLVSHQSFSGHNGDAIATSRTQIPAGYDLVGNANWNSHLTIGNTDSTVTVTVAQHEDHHATTPTDPTDHNDEPKQSTPTQPTDNRGTDNQGKHNAAAQLPAGTKVVNGHVVDAQGNVAPGWQVVNGQAVQINQPLTREAYRAQQAKAKKLPQTGSQNNATLVALGMAGLLGMLGLAGVNKKDN